MHYCIVHFLTMLRKEQSIGFCREPRVERKMFKICQGFIDLIVYYYLYSSSARGLLICRHPRLDHAIQNLVIYGGSFSGQETSLVTSFDG